MGWHHKRNASFAVCRMHALEASQEQKTRERSRFTFFSTGEKDEIKIDNAHIESCNMGVVNLL